MWNMYIAGEVGGMGESLARLSEMVSAPEEKARLIEASIVLIVRPFTNRFQRILMIYVTDTPISISP